MRRTLRRTARAGRPSEDRPAIPYNGFGPRGPVFSDFPGLTESDQLQTSTHIEYTRRDRTILQLAPPGVCKKSGLLRPNGASREMHCTCAPHPWRMGRCSHEVGVRTRSCADIERTLTGEESCLNSFVGSDAGSVASRPIRMSESLRSLTVAARTTLAPAGRIILFTLRIDAGLPSKPSNACTQAHTPCPVRIP